MMFSTASCVEVGFLIANQQYADPRKQVEVLFCSCGINNILTISIYPKGFGKSPYLVTVWQIRAFFGCVRICLGSDRQLRITFQFPAYQACESN